MINCDDLFLPHNGRSGFRLFLQIMGFIGVQAVADFTASTIGPTQRLGDDPDALPENRRAQAEPHLIRSYSDPNLLVATFQEGRFEDGGAFNNGVSISRDGGLTWSRELLPGLVKGYERGRFDRASDPVAAVDNNGNIYINSLGVEITATDEKISTVVVNRLTPGRTIWDRARIVASGDVPQNFLDKNWFTINTYPGTSNEGRIAVTYSDIIDAGPFGVSPLAISLSDSRGSRWTIPHLFGAPLSQATRPMFFPDGSLGIVYLNFVDFISNPPRTRLEYIYSADGGVTFDAPDIIHPFQMHDDPIARDGTWMPSATVSRQSGTLFVVYQALGPNQIPQVQFTKSIDRGMSWSAPMAINDTPDSQSVFNPAVAASPDGQHLTVVFYDKRDSTNPSLVHLYLAESFDGGDTWEANQRVSREFTNMRLAPLTERGRMIGDYHGIVPALSFDRPGFAIWIDTQSGSPDPVVASIERRQGTNFDTWRRLRYSPSDLSEESISGAGADIDQDGLTNLEEYAYGYEPDLPNQLPRLEMQRSVESDQQIEISYRRLAVLGDIVFLFEESSDLRTWNPIKPLAITRSTAPNPILENVRVSLPLHSEGSRFIRVRPTLNSSE